MNSFPDASQNTSLKQAFTPKFTFTVTPSRKKPKPKKGQGTFPLNLAQLCIGPFNIPLTGSNVSPSSVFDPLRHLSNPILTHNILEKNPDISLALLAEDPHNPFYVSLRKWFLSLNDLKI